MVSTAAARELRPGQFIVTSQLGRVVMVPTEYASDHDAGFVAVGEEAVKCLDSCVAVGQSPIDADWTLTVQAWTGKTRTVAVHSARVTQYSGKIVA